MKACSAELLALLKSKQFYEVELFTIEFPSGGNPLRYCSGDRDVAAAGFKYSSGGVTGPYFQTDSNQVKLHQKIGLDVDNITFDVIPGSATVNGVPFLQAVKNRVFDGCIVTVERAYMPTYGDTSIGTVIVFKGRLGGISAGRSVLTMQVNSMTELLNVEFPRNVYQAACVNTLGDSMCGVNLDAFGIVLTVTTGSTTSSILANVTNATAGYYDLGRLKFTTGALAGIARPVQTVTFGSPGTIALFAPFPTAPANGDNCILYPGCDKSWSGTNGCPKFTNQARFRGFPAIPQPITGF